MMRSKIERSCERVEAAPHRDAGVVDDHVDAAERLERLGDQPLADPAGW